MRDTVFVTVVMVFASVALYGAGVRTGLYEWLYRIDPSGLWDGIGGIVTGLLAIAIGFAALWLHDARGDRR